MAVSPDDDFGLVGLTLTSLWARRHLITIHVVPVERRRTLVFTLEDMRQQVQSALF